MAKRKPDRIDRAAAKMTASMHKLKAELNKDKRSTAAYWNGDSRGSSDGIEAAEQWVNEQLAVPIAALVRREVRRAVKDERAHLRGEVVRIKANLSGGVPVLVDQWRQCLNTIERWLDAREGR